MRGLRRRPRARAGGCCDGRRRHASSATRPRRAPRVPHPRRHQGRGRSPSPDPWSVLRRPGGLRDAVLRDGAHSTGSPVRSRPCLQAGRRHPRRTARALEELIDALVAIHAVDWEACGLGDLAHAGDYLARQLTRWLTQLDSYGGRDLPGRPTASPTWLGAHRPAGQPSALCHGDYKLDNVLFAPESPPRLLAVVDWEMAAHRRPAGRSGVGAHLPPGAGGHHAAWAWPRSRGSTSITSPTGARWSSVTRPARAATSRQSAGTTCSPDGSWPSCSRAATPSSCAACPTSRCTSSSAPRSTCCSPAPATIIDRRRSDLHTRRMRAWQVHRHGRALMRPTVLARASRSRFCTPYPGPPEPGPGRSGSG